MKLLKPNHPDGFLLPDRGTKLRHVQVDCQWGVEGTGETSQAHAATTRVRRGVLLPGLVTGARFKRADTWSLKREVHS